MKLWSISRQYCVYGQMVMMMAIVMVHNSVGVAVVVSIGGGGCCCCSLVAVRSEILSLEGLDLLSDAASPRLGGVIVDLDNPHEMIRTRGEESESRQ